MNTQSFTIEEIWRRYDEDEQRLSAPLSERMLELAKLEPGMRVLDLATGRGEPAIRAAKRVGPSGSVLGIDIAESMLDMARTRAIAENVTNLELRVMDAQKLDESHVALFHVTLARWCLMYFSDPVQSLRAAHRAMIPRGTFVGAVWAEPDRVSYYTFPRQVLSAISTIPPTDLDTPGPFFYSDVDRLRRDFESAGFRIDCIEEIEVAVMQAHSGEELIAWCRAFGLNRLLQNVEPSLQQQWEENLISQSAKYRVDGAVQLGGTTRIVVATAEH